MKRLDGATRAVLFDMDGVLVHSVEAWFAVIGAATREWGCAPVSRDFFDRIFGQGVDADALNLFPGRTPAEITAFYDTRFADFLDLVTTEPGAHEVMAELARRGLGSAIVTNTPQALATQILARAGNAPCGLRADHLVGADQVAAAKPAPHIVLRACELLGVAPAQAVLVGDSRYDREAARAAGTPFIPFRQAALPGDLPRLDHLRDLL